MIDIGIIHELDKKKDYSSDYSEEICEYYGCISIDEDDMSEFLSEIYEKKIPASYCIYGRNVSYGIDPCGVTLLSPDSVRMIMDIMRKYSDMSWYTLLQDQCKKAIDENKYMIVFGA